MIVTLCADKGSPGVSDLATALALVWPGERLLLEADTAGGDLPFRLQHADGDRLLDTSPSVLSLAADARGALPADRLPRYAQPTSLGVPVVPGALSAESFTPMARLWPHVADAAAAWSGTVLADLGRLQPGHAALPVARASTAVLLLARPDLAGLFHLRDRVAELAATVGEPARERTPVAVVVRARSGLAGKAAVDQVRQMLEAAGSPVPVAGMFADDPRGLGLMRAGQPSRQLLRSDLIRSVRSLSETVVSWWPELAADPMSTTATPPAIDDRAPDAPRRGRVSA